MQGPGGSESAGAAGGVTAGARSGRGNHGSGGRRGGWRREGGGVGDAAGGSSTTSFHVLREEGVGSAGRGSIEKGVLGHGGISPGPAAQEGRGWMVGAEGGIRGKSKESCPVGADRLLEHGHIGSRGR